MDRGGLSQERNSTRRATFYKKYESVLFKFIQTVYGIKLKVSIIILTKLRSNS